MIHFKEMSDLEAEMCQNISVILANAIKTKGHATLLLSGGGTPKGLYHLLSLQKIEWNKIEIGLVDERFVASNSSYSNAKMIKDILIQNEAENAKLSEMVLNIEDYEANCELVNEEYKKFECADVVILGMGGDGHTASIFPNDIKSDECLLDKSPAILNTTAPIYPEQRITLNRPFIQSAENTFLLFSGTSKKSIFEKASNDPFPIQHFKEYLTAIYYAEK